MSSAPPDAGPPAAAPPGPGRGWRGSPYGVRLALGYAALFALSAAALLGTAYAALGWVLERQDAAYLRDQLRALERVHAEGGVEGVRRHAAALHADDRGEEVPGVVTKVVPSEDLADDPARAAVEDRATGDLHHPWPDEGALHRRAALRGTTHALRFVGAASRRW